MSILIIVKSAIQTVQNGKFHCTSLIPRLSLLRGGESLGTRLVHKWLDRFPRTLIEAKVG